MPGDLEWLQSGLDWQRHQNDLLRHRAEEAETRAIEAEHRMATAEFRARALRVFVRDRLPWELKAMESRWDLWSAQAKALRNGRARD